MSWYMIVNRFLYFRDAQDEMYRFEERFWSGIDLSQLYREGNERASDGQAILGMESIFRAGFKEFSRLAQQPEMDSEAVIEGSRRAMRVAVMREEERLERHLAFLASVGSTSPYIGLFGTVWGIMHSFRGLGQFHTGDPGDRGTGHFGGPGGHGHGPVCSHTRGAGLQPLRRPGGGLQQSLRHVYWMSSPGILSRQAYASAQPRTTGVLRVSGGPVASKRKPMAEINVVPYIDVMLVLLIIFMVTAPC